MSAPPIAGTENPFGAMLRELRRAAGLTQEALAERAQISERAVRSLELSRERTPRPQTVRLLGDALGLDDTARAVLLAAARPRAVRKAEKPPAVTCLPHFLTPLLGRSEEIAIVKLLLEERRLVTVAGAGGVGKTRLAVAVANQMLGKCDRVVFVDLAPRRDHRRIAGAIAAALSIREDPAHSLFDIIVRDIRSQPTLVVLDNMEQLLPGSELVLSLLAACPDLSILVTSREALHVRGERVYTVAPLALPEREANIERSPAVRLFLDRARDSGVEMKLDDTTVGVLPEICRRLDGLPLAIELAAAWTPLLSPDALLSRLSSGLPPMNDLGRDLPARQRTMRAAVAWSYDLLSPEQQKLLSRLSVFTGGCSLQAAQAVCGGMGEFEIDLLPAMMSLLGKNLLTVQDDDASAVDTSTPSQPRFGMLETVRQFAYDELSSRSEVKAAKLSHAQYFLALSEEIESHPGGHDRRSRLARLEVEHNNLREALRTAQQNDDIVLGLRLVGSLGPFWLAHRHFDEARRWIDEFIPNAGSPDVPAGVRAAALLVAGALVDVEGDNELALARARQALCLAREAESVNLVVAAVHQIARVECDRGNYGPAEQLLREAEVTYRRTVDLTAISTVLRDRAVLARYQGDFESADALYREALKLTRTVGDPSAIADLLARFGNMATEQGSPSKSIPRYEEALSLYQELGDVLGIADVHLRWGETATSQGDYTEAIRHCDQSLRSARSIGARYTVAWALMNKGEATLSLGYLDQAEDIQLQSLDLFREIGDPRCIATALMYLAGVAHARRDIAHAQQLYEESLTLHRGLNTRPEIARCLERMAGLASDEGYPERAACLGGAAAALRVRMASSLGPADHAKRDNRVGVLRRAMGDDAFGLREAQGRSMSLDQAVTYALEGG